MVLFCIIICCKLLKIKWTERITNEAVLTKITKKQDLWRNIKVRRNKMIGHLLHHESLTKSVIEGDINGYIGR